MNPLARSQWTGGDNAAVDFKTELGEEESTSQHGSERQPGGKTESTPPTQVMAK
jgi:hypothetical protein